VSYAAGAFCAKSLILSNLLPINTALCDYVVCLINLLLIECDWTKWKLDTWSEHMLRRVPGTAVCTTRPL